MQDRLCCAQVAAAGRELRGLEASLLARGRPRKEHGDIDQLRAGGCWPEPGQRLRVASEISPLGERWLCDLDRGDRLYFIANAHEVVFTTHTGAADRPLRALLLALPRLPLEGVFTGQQVREVLAGRVLAEATFSGTYTLNRRLL